MISRFTVNFTIRFLVPISWIPSKLTPFPTFAIVLIAKRILKFDQISVSGTLYVTYPVFSSNIDVLYGVILPDLMNLQRSHSFPTVFYWNWHFPVTSNDVLRFK